MLGNQRFFNGIQFKDLGIKLKSLGTEIQKIGMNISLINNNYGIQLNNMGMMISNISMEIYNIGIQISNLSNIEQQNIFQMNNIINNMNMKMMNFNHQINESEINDYNIDNSNKINIIFSDRINGGNISIFVNKNKTIKELFNLYIKKKGGNEVFLKKYVFLYNGKNLNKNDNTRIMDYGIVDKTCIIVSEEQNLNGGPFISLKITGGNLDYPLVVGLNSENLIDYLIKYLEKTGQSNLKEKLVSFPSIYIIDFFKAINEINP